MLPLAPYNRPARTSARLAVEATTPPAGGTVQTIIRAFTAAGGIAGEQSVPRQQRTGQYSGSDEVCTATRSVTAASADAAAGDTEAMAGDKHRGSGEPATGSHTVPPSTETLMASQPQRVSAARAAEAMRTAASA